MLNQLKEFWQKIDKKLKLSTLGTLFLRAQVGYVGPTFAYFALLTVFPMLIAIAIIISITNVSETNIISLIQSVLPRDIEKIVLPILQSVLSSKSTSLLSFSVLFTLWTVSRVIAVFRVSFNRIADVEDRISNLLSRFWSFVWLLIIIAAFGVLMIGSNVLTIVLQQIPSNQWTSFLQHQTKWLIWLGMWLALIMMNYLLPTKEGRAPLRFVAIGSLIEVGALNILNIGFSWYTNLAVKQYGFYQSMSAIIVLLIWLNLIATILVTGYILIQWLTVLKQEKVINI
ncbi:YihY/virulence factor BrkB family protein [Leuconostoc gelidum subsp. gelidum]|uniref:YihY/virulence factor BrkB family protein n=1 Tax=Leuconostoc gelidum subsp. gelidum TaxID=1607839 RepID=A0AB35G1T1_LEUGE|nr:YihY/virulence factor BrkB family protein [Leuconostoc gelidum]MBZ5964556.1 YihY/virulence factor BrkB family protein [Leuconostoc gelidum subsp. gelidum]MBZ5974839.1 YihY/virulence factor BrkB family protein [Leuconostoc gelidum subsp. gelidum]MBZ5977679.1 YihY/virulence factor BrkB family protein [Leuconostoc gelidum subsp. gelidum]MBZ5986383.1 YihY/virulence factor BrkB family protein [Leuconostoc gelidum subsp. gelidum]MBZ5999390.1 YihY/virulence factor BrkB family protein [Leuconostoc 